MILDPYYFMVYEIIPHKKLCSRIPLPGNSAIATLFWGMVSSRDPFQSIVGDLPNAWE